MTDAATLRAELEKIKAALVAQDALEGLIPQDQLQAQRDLLNAKLAELQAQLQGPGAIAQGQGSAAAGAGPTGWLEYLVLADICAYTDHHGRRVRMG